MNDIKGLREEIDKTDKKILELLSRRFSLVKMVGEYKKKNNLPILDLKREEEILQKKTTEGEKVGLSKSFVRKIWQLFFEEAYLHEK